MALATLDRNPPPLFNQGASALSKLLVFCALAVFLMVADGRWRVGQIIRSGISTALAPAHAVLRAPHLFVQSTAKWFTTVDQLQTQSTSLKAQLLSQSQQRLDQNALLQENARLRDLLGLKERFAPRALTAQVLRTNRDLFSHKLTLDKGLQDGVVVGSAVMDHFGLVGQITRANPFESEITLLTQHLHTTPVQLERTGLRGLAYGLPRSDFQRFELRLQTLQSDVIVGDSIVTSGIDGIYPAGLKVGTVTDIEQQDQARLAIIKARAATDLLGAKQVIIVAPTP